MLFHTASFALFFALVWPIYWALRNHARARIILLTLASWGFYSAWDWRFTGLLLASTGVDYLCARRIAASEAPATRRRWLGLSLSFNLGVLASFKYLDFFASSTAALLESLGLHASWTSLHVVLPVGISFYTFQTLGYTIDVYRGRQQATGDPWLFAAYVAFFPQLVAGPIERASSLLPQLQGPPRLDLREQLEGARRFTVGLWKKLIIADNLGVFVDWVFAIPPDEVLGYQVALGVLAFAGQIWADFSGYTDMALGLAAMLGIRLMENFDAPYLARGARDFWRRWHISLSTWLRDYLYIPLGGNRRGPLRTQLNLLLTMLLGGLWHGAAWTFVAWGGFHGLWLALERALARLRGRDEPGGGPIGALLGVVGTFALVCVGWLLFRAPSMTVAWGYAVAVAADLTQLHTWTSPAAAIDARYVLHFGAPVLILQLARRALVRRDPPASADPRTTAYVGWAIAAYAVLALLTEPIGKHDAPFVYFQF